MNVVLQFLANTAFIWLTIILFFLFRRVYLEYKEQSYKLNKLGFSDYIMLEINVPKEVYKSPQAMEFVIDVLHHLGGGGMDWKHHYWKGSILHPASLEIVSIEGSIYFFMRVHKQLASLVKTTIYSQFPQAEVNEVDDYTRYVPDYTKHQDSWALYGADFKLLADDFLPIKTYVDYGLDQQVGKMEEFQKIDPLTPMIEFLSTIGPGEQIWLQYVIRGDAKSDWRKRAEAFIKEKMSNGQNVGDAENPFQMPRLSPGEQDQIKAVQRSLSKHAFETRIRGIYIAKKENENPGIVGYFKNPIFKPFSSLFLNGIKKDDDTGFDWVWEDFTGKRDLKKKRIFFTKFVTRDAFYGFNSFTDIILGPFRKQTPPPLIFTSEELATLFHLPGTVSETPSLERIESIKSQPPVDLPV